MTKKNDGVNLTVQLGEKLDQLVLDGSITDPDVIAAIRKASADPDGDLSDGLKEVLSRGVSELTRVREVVPKAFEDGVDPIAVYEILANFGDEKAPAIYDMLVDAYGIEAITPSTVRTVVKALDENIDPGTERSFLWKA